MSGTPSQQCGHPHPDNRAYNPRSRSDMSRMIYEPYIHHEPRQAVAPNAGCYQRQILTTPPPPRLPSLGSLPGAIADPRYILSSDNGYVNHDTTIPHTLPLRVHPHGPVIDPRAYPVPYEERSNPMFSHGREYATQQMRTFDQESQYSNTSTNISSPVHFEKSPISYPKPTNTPQEPSSKPRNPGYSMPHGFDKLLHHEPESSSPPPPSTRRPSTQSRYHLHVRQQPIAARACGAGDRDRRPVDPPPIVQILLTDFDPESQEDRDILEDPRFTVGCLLFPVSDVPPYQPNTANEDQPPEGEGDGVARADDTFSTPLLSGKAFMSPFFVDADPDPNSAPTHPSFDNTHQASSPGLSQPENLRNAKTPSACDFLYFRRSIHSLGRVVSVTISSYELGLC